MTPHEKKSLALAKKAKAKPPLTEKIYKFKGYEYKIKPVTLEMKDKWQDVIDHRTFLERVYTEDLNLSKVQQYQKRISDLMKGLNSFTPEFIESHKGVYKTKVKIFKQKIDEVKMEMANDYEAVSIQEYYLSRMQSAFKKWLLSVNIMKPFFRLILQGDFSKLDWNDLEMADFISEVIVGFFGLLGKSSQKLLS